MYNINNRAGGGQFGLSFAAGDFDVGIDGDLLLAGIAAAAALFFYATYAAITGRKRKKRSISGPFSSKSYCISFA